MNYSKGTNYALHTMLYLASQDENPIIGVQELADHQGVSSSYLSKILTKLTKQGLIESHSGAQGGYRLSRDKYSISFLEIIQAIEGNAPLFKGCESNKPGCLIEDVMMNSEKRMDEYLQSQMIGDIAEKATLAQK
ncbi:Rrf2 family transcriptional regulator [Alkalihalobacillus sp. FSL R5-0424]